MCCLLLGSTSIINALGNLDSDIVFSSANINNSSVTVNESVEPTNTSANTTMTTNASNTANTTNTIDSASATSSQHNSSDSSSQATNTIDQTIPTQDVPPASIIISAVGDLMAHQSNLNNAYNSKTSTYDFSGFLALVKPYLTKSDLTIGNFETVTAGPNARYTSYPSFNTPDSMLTALSNAGFDVLSTANNHCLDRGINGLTRTIQKNSTEQNDQYR